MNFSEDKIIEIYNKFVKKNINYFNETITDICPVKNGIIYEDLKDTMF